MASTKTTTDHEEIRIWAERRGGEPARVRGTGDGGDPGMLRIEFPNYNPQTEEKLEPISWEDWLAAFDANELALVYQDKGSDGKLSYFAKLVSRDTVEAREEGQAHASVHYPSGR